MIEANDGGAVGHIHAGKVIRPGGRYDRILRYLRAHPGATTRDICLHAEVYAFTATISELRRMGYVIDSEFVRTSEGGAKVHRYYLDIDENRKAAAPVARQETQPEGAGITPAGNTPAPSAVKQEDLWQR
jgi:hypothetical protein